MSNYYTCIYMYVYTPGLKVLCKNFPQGIISGHPPPSCLPTPPSSSRRSRRAPSPPPPILPPQSHPILPSYGGASTDLIYVHVQYSVILTVIKRWDVTVNLELQKKMLQILPQFLFWFPDIAVLQETLDEVLLASEYNYTVYTHVLCVR